MTVGRGFGRRWRGLTAAVSAWSLVSVIGVGWTPPPAVAAGTAAASGPVAPTPIGAGAPVGPPLNTTGTGATPPTPFGPAGPTPAGATAPDLPMPAPSSHPVALPQARTAYSQMVLNPNGTWTTTVTLEPQFYQTPDHQWHTIRDTLVLNAAGTAWQTQANAFQVAIGTTGTAGHLVSLTQGPLQIAFGLEQAGAVVPTVAGAHATFTGVLPSVTAQYTALPTGVREDLLLQNANAPSTLAFPLTVTGATPHDLRDRFE